jgi:hypothetical protein
MDIMVIIEREIEGKIITPHTNIEIQHAKYA